MNILRFMIPKSLSVHISSDSTVRQAVEKMRYHRYAALPVLDSEGRYVGTVRNDEILDFGGERPNTGKGLSVVYNSYKGNYSVNY